MENFESGACVVRDARGVFWTRRGNTGRGLPVDDGSIVRGRRGRMVE